MGADDLVRYQRGTDRGAQYDLLDLVQRYVGTVRGRSSYKRSAYTYVRSFFMHNRAALPEDKSFTILGDTPKVVEDLSPETIRDLVMTCNPLYRAVFLIMFQAGMGQDELIFWSNTGWPKLEEQLVKDPRLIRVDLPGRKKVKNIRPYYTFIAGDALDALRNYLKYRSTQAKAIFVNERGEPLRKHSLWEYWTRHGRRIGLIEPIKTLDKSHRMGRNVHEIRDAFKSQWAKSPAKILHADYYMGHIIDKDEYDKSFRDEQVYRAEYLKALPWLNIISSPRPFHLVEEESVEDLRLEVEQLRKYEDVVGNLRELVFKLQERIEQMDKPKLSG